MPVTLSLESKSRKKVSNSGWAEGGGDINERIAVRVIHRETF